MIQRYSVGDIVELNSGSPDMTVTAALEGSVAVAWCGNDFGTGVMHQTELPIGAIKRVEPEPPRRDDRSPRFGALPRQSHLDDDIPF
jgi:uncharacterized protein YodC (DUF2158 family)